MVDESTLTVTLQCHDSDCCHTCKVTFDNDLELAMLQVTFALKAAVKEYREKKIKEQELLLKKSLLEIVKDDPEIQEIFKNDLALLEDDQDEL